MKSVKLLFTIIVCAGSMFVIDSLISAFSLSYGITTFVLNLLPLAYTSIAFLYLMTAFSVSIVAFIGGIIFSVNPKTIRLAAITYIVVSWFASISWYVFVSLQVSESSYFEVLLICIPNIILLVTLPALSKWLCFKGGILGENIRKHKSQETNNCL